MRRMLDELVAGARERASVLMPHRERLQRHVASMGPSRSLGAALGAPGLGVIAEIKRRSPSVGGIAPDLDPRRLGRSYEEGGAVAVSVLTDPVGFGAFPADLPSTTRTVSVPVLRKDFIVMPEQVWETRAMGADAILLIAAIVNDETLEGLVAEAERAGIAALVEAHTADEVHRAVAAGAAIVGVNNRDLTTFAVSLVTAERLRDLIPNGVISVAESGISSPQDARRMRSAGYDAVLVGEAASRAEDPARFIASLMEPA